MCAEKIRVKERELLYLRHPSGLAVRHPRVVVCFFFARFRFGPRGDFTSSACEALCWYSMIFRFGAMSSVTYVTNLDLAYRNTCLLNFIHLPLAHIPSSVSLTCYAYTRLSILGIFARCRRPRIREMFPYTSRGRQALNDIPRG